MFLTNVFNKSTNLAPEITFKKVKLGPWDNFTILYIYIYIHTCIYLPESYFEEPLFGAISRVNSCTTLCWKMLLAAARSTMKLSSCTTGKLVPVPQRRSKNNTGTSSPAVRELTLCLRYVFHIWDSLCLFFQNNHSKPMRAHRGYGI